MGFLPAAEKRYRAEGHSGFTWRHGGAPLLRVGRQGEARVERGETGCGRLRLDRLAAGGRTCLQVLLTQLHLFTAAGRLWHDGLLHKDDRALSVRAVYLVSRIEQPKEGLHRESGNLV